MRHIRRFFAPSTEYLTYTQNLGRLDAGLALAVYGIFFFWSLAYALLSYPTYTPSASYTINAIHIACMIAIPLLFIKLMGQPVASAGLRLAGTGHSLLLALLPIALLCGGRAILALSGGATFALSGGALFAFLLWQFIKNIGEELLFRGYIGSRLYGAMRHKWLSVLLTAFLFEFIHTPERMVSGAAAFGVSPLEFLLSPYYLSVILNIVLFSCIAAFIHMKTNNLAGAVLFHTLWNLSYQFSY